MIPGCLATLASKREVLLTNYRPSIVVITLCFTHLISCPLLLLYSLFISLLTSNEAKLFYTDMVKIVGTLQLIKE